MMARSVAVLALFTLSIAAFAIDSGFHRVRFAPGNPTDDWRGQVQRGDY